MNIAVHAGSEASMGLCVLVVDDDLPIQSIVADVLTEVGYEVLLANNGAEALRHLRARVPDVMITDLRMPVLDGWSLVQMCRAEPTLKDVPVVVITAERDHHAEPLAALGVVEVVSKPFDIQRLLTTIVGRVAA
jgi:chemosensory pili system protein ChpA (sensor histidine kinase/response regulator)